jgi:hypothetical protein
MRQINKMQFYYYATYAYFICSTGNEQMYLLTNNGSTYKMRVDFVTDTDQWYWAEYTNFRIDSEANKYAMHYGIYSGTAGGCAVYSCSTATFIDYFKCTNYHKFGIKHT